MFGADLTLAAGRMLTFVLLGISLGPGQLGRYVAVLGMTQLLYPVSRWGIAHLMVRAISRGAPFDQTWAKTVSANVVGGLIGSGVAVVVGGILFDVGALSILLIGLAQLVGLGLQQAGGMAAAAHGRAEVGLAVNGANTVLRVGAVVLFWTLGERTVDVWVWYLLASSLTGAVATQLVVARFLGGRLRLVFPDRVELALGAPFVLVDSANTAQADIDKVVLGGYGLDVDNGVYAAAYRVADLANLPLGALVRASYSEFFRRGSATLAEAVRYARKLTLVATGYGLVIGCALWFTAPLLGVIMGDEFDESVTALRWIAFIPLLRAGQYFPANVLSGVDRQWQRARIMSSTALLNLGLNLVLVPRHGWRGAAVSTFVAEAVYMLLLWTAVRSAVRDGGDEHRR